jgi:cyclopropane-fatty-acyl-phospholipid synthase
VVATARRDLRGRSINDGKFSSTDRNLALDRQARPSWLVQATRAISRRILQSNSVGVARRNAAHHYDLSHILYQQFLDSDLQYSCAYFHDHGQSLDEAQDAKCRHLAAKLLLQPGQRVLDIGCGWGGLAMSLAKIENVQVVGVTLSRAQLVIAQQRARQAGLEQRVTFELRDYREIKGKFDRIVSVGMLEHVGTPHYPEFFETVSRLFGGRRDCPHPLDWPEDWSRYNQFLD